MCSTKMICLLTGKYIHAGKTRELGQEILIRFLGSRIELIVASVMGHRSKKRYERFSNEFRASFK